MVTLNIRSVAGEADTVKGFLTEGLEEEKKRIKFALEVSVSKIKGYETKFGIPTATFIEKFKNGEIDENDDTFNWWAEERLSLELLQKINILENIEICQ